MRAPEITEGVWNWENDGSTSLVLGGAHTRIAVTFANGKQAADDRFLAGSKRVAEAAAEVLANHDPEALAVHGALYDLRRALLASGYTEEESL